MLVIPLSPSSSETVTESAANCTPCAGISATRVTMSSVVAGAVIEPVASSSCVSPAGSEEAANENSTVCGESGVL